MALTTAFIFSPDSQPLPALVRGWLDAQDFPVTMVSATEELLSAALRSRPRLVVIDTRTSPDATLKLCEQLKSDSYTGIVPVCACTRNDDASFTAAFDAGADEVLRDDDSATDVSLRLTALLRRSDRDTHVHPSTRLPGTTEIEANITQRLESGELFATCYADLDHFKEYNDRYSYYDGDRVIRILARILHDVVKGTCRDTAFVGHIGGDDFIFMMPLDQLQDTCSEIVATFDALIPYQYSEQDRRAGYYFGKDRRGALHKVPLMTVSIGIVTNERRTFTHAAQVSELATEMKSYAKTLPGSVFTIDRRGDRPDNEPLAIDPVDAATIVEEQ